MISDDLHSQPLIAEHIQAYVDWLGNQRYSKKSLELYRQALDRFELFLLSSGVSRIQDVTMELLNQYRLNLVNRGFSGATVYVYLRSVRLLFKYLEDRHQVFINPTATMVIPANRGKLQPVPSEEVVSKLLLQPNTSTAVGIRDRALMETAYSCGLRRGELTGLSILSPDLKQGLLRVMGKGSKERVVPLGKQALFWLRQYMEHARPKLVKKQGEHSLWVSKTTGTGLSHARIDKLIREYAVAAGVEERLSVHCLRRACATHMLRGGAHPVSIQLLLGHSSLKSLSQYLKITITDLKKMHERSNPGQ